MVKELNKARIEILLLFFLYLIIMPRVYMAYDMGFWREWALYIHQHGVSNAYNSTTNYFPVYIYILYLFDLVQGTDISIAHNINYIKDVFVFFDFLPLFVLCCFRQKILSYKIPYLYLLLNIAYLFNSMIWGQIDSIFISLVFLAILVAVSYPIVGFLLYLLALNTKPQAIVFLPVMFFVLWYSVRNIKTFLSGLVTAVALQAVILLPFIKSGGVGRLIYISSHSVDLYNKLSICAFNIWYLIARGNPYFINDKDTYFLLSYKQVGLILFAISGITVLLPLFFRLYRDRVNNLKPGDDTYRLLFLSTGLLSLYFFYFNAQMHERYAQPIIIFFFFYAVVSKNYKLYILASIPYFLSLDKCFPDYLPIVHYKVIYASKVIALWYTATVIYGSYEFFRQYSIRGEFKKLVADISKKNGYS